MSSRSLWFPREELKADRVGQAQKMLADAFKGVGDTMGSAVDQIGNAAKDDRLGWAKAQLDQTMQQFREPPPPLDFDPTEPPLSNSRIREPEPEAEVAPPPSPSPTPAPDPGFNPKSLAQQAGDRFSDLGTAVHDIGFRAPGTDGKGILGNTGLGKQVRDASQWSEDLGNTYTPKALSADEGLFGERGPLQKALDPDVGNDPNLAGLKLGLETSGLPSQAKGAVRTGGEWLKSLDTLGTGLDKVTGRDSSLKERGQGALETGMGVIGAVAPQFNYVGNVAAERAKEQGLNDQQAEVVGAVVGFLTPGGGTEQLGKAGAYLSRTQPLSRLGRLGGMAEDFARTTGNLGESADDLAKMGRFKSLAPAAAMGVAAPIGGFLGGREAAERNGNAGDIALGALGGATRAADLTGGIGEMGVGAAQNLVRGARRLPEIPGRLAAGLSAARDGTGRLGIADGVAGLDGATSVDGVAGKPKIDRALKLDAAGEVLGGIAGAQLASQGPLADEMIDDENDPNARLKRAGLGAVGALVGSQAGGKLRRNLGTAQRVAEAFRTGEAPGTRERMIPPAVARGLSLNEQPVDYEFGRQSGFMPNRVDIAHTIRNTKGARLFPDGTLELDLYRYGKPRRELNETGRGGVFYGATKEHADMYNSGDAAAEGGQVLYKGPTAFRNPLFVDETGAMGRDVVSAFIGKAQYEQARDRLDTMLHSGSPDARQRAAEAFQELGWQPDESLRVVDALRDQVSRGRGLEYALPEAMGSGMLRSRGYEAAIGIRRASEGRGAQMGEVFDVREAAYPGQGPQDFRVQPEFTGTTPRSLAPGRATEPALKQIARAEQEGRLPKGMDDRRELRDEEVLRHIGLDQYSYEGLPQQAKLELDRHLFDADADRSVSTQDLVKRLLNTPGGNRTERWSSQAAYEGQTSQTGMTSKQYKTKGKLPTGGEAYLADISDTNVEPKGVVYSPSIGKYLTLNPATGEISESSSYFSAELKLLKNNPGLQPDQVTKAENLGEKAASLKYGSDPVATGPDDQALEDKIAFALGKGPAPSQASTSVDPEKPGIPIPDHIQTITEKKAFMADYPEGQIFMNPNGLTWYIKDSTQDKTGYDYAYNPDDAKLVSANLTGGEPLVGEAAPTGKAPATPATPEPDYLPPLLSVQQSQDYWSEMPIGQVWEDASDKNFYVKTGPYVDQWLPFATAAQAKAHAATMKGPGSPASGSAEANAAAAPNPNAVFTPEEEKFGAVSVETTEDFKDVASLYSPATVFHNAEDGKYYVIDSHGPENALSFPLDTKEDALYQAWNLKNGKWDTADFPKDPNFEEKYIGDKPWLEDYQGWPKGAEAPGAVGDGVPGGDEPPAGGMHYTDTHDAMDQQWAGYKVGDVVYVSDDDGYYVKVSDDPDVSPFYAEKAPALNEAKIWQDLTSQPPAETYDQWGDAEYAAAEEKLKKGIFTEDNAASIDDNWDAYKTGNVIYNAKSGNYVIKAGEDADNPNHKMYFSDEASALEYAKPFQPKAEPAPTDWSKTVVKPESELNSAFYADAPVGAIVQNDDTGAYLVKISGPSKSNPEGDWDFFQSSMGAEKAASNAKTKNPSFWQKLKAGFKAFGSDEANLLGARAGARRPDGAGGEEAGKPVRRAGFREETINGRTWQFTKDPSGKGWLLAIDGKPQTDAPQRTLTAARKIGEDNLKAEFPREIGATSDPQAAPARVNRGVHPGGPMGPENRIEPSEGEVTGNSVADEMSKLARVQRRLELLAKNVPDGPDKDELLEGLSVMRAQNNARIAELREQGQGLGNQAKDEIAERNRIGKLKQTKVERDLADQRALGMLREEGQPGAESTDVEGQAPVTDTPQEAVQQNVAQGKQPQTVEDTQTNPPVNNPDEVNLDGKPLAKAKGPTAAESERQIGQTGVRRGRDSTTSTAPQGPGVPKSKQTGNGDFGATMQRIDPGNKAGSPRVRQPRVTQVTTPTGTVTTATPGTTAPTTPTPPTPRAPRTPKQGQGNPPPPKTPKTPPPPPTPAPSPRTADFGWLDERGKLRPMEQLEATVRKELEDNFQEWKSYKSKIDAATSPAEKTKLQAEYNTKTQTRVAKKVAAISSMSVADIIKIANNPADASHAHVQKLLKQADTTALMGTNPEWTVTDFTANLARVNLIGANPVTMARNAMGGVASLAWHPLEAAVASAIDTPLAAVRQMRGLETKLDRRYGKESRFILNGYARALPAALTNAFAALEKGQQYTAYGLKQAQESMKTGSQATKTSGKIADRLLAPLTATDAFFRTLTQGGELMRQTYRGLKDQGMSEADINKQMVKLLQGNRQDFVKATSKTMVDGLEKGVEQQINYRAFTQDLDKLGQALQSVQKIPVAGSFVMPFVTTPYNAAKFDLERSVIGGLVNSGKITADLVKGQTNISTGEQADRLARGMMGSALFAGLVGGMTTGIVDLNGALPDNPGERDEWEAEGRKPYTIRIGDRWVSFQDVPGLNATLMQAAVVKDILNKYGSDDKSYGPAVVRGILEATRTLAAQPMASGALEAAEAISSPGTRAEKFAGGLLNPALPLSGVARTVTTAGDQFQRVAPQPFNIGEQVSRVYAPENLARKRTVTGRSLVNPNQGLSAVNPLRTSSTVGFKVPSRYVTSSGAHQDTQMNQAVARVNAWKKDPVNNPMPSNRDFIDADLTKGTKNEYGDFEREQERGRLAGENMRRGKK